MKIRDLIQAPPRENYIKNSSMLVTALLIIGGILYYPTTGYGTLIALVLALMVLFGQKLLLAQINKDFADMYFAKQQYEHTQNADYLNFIAARTAQILADNKVLSTKAKRELAQLQQYTEQHLGS